MAYARDTSVSVERSRAEIERLVTRHGATQFVSGWNESSTAMLGFVFGKRAIRFLLPMPDPKADEFCKTPGRGKPRQPADAYRLWEQACRSRWRALLLVIKAKLEAVEADISTIEEEFMAFTVVPGDGRTIGQMLLPEIAASIESGRKPQLLLTRRGG